jgi:hypothetical protein
MNSAEVINFGGIATMILTHQTQFEIVFERTRKALDVVADRREKLIAANAAFIEKLADDRLLKSADLSKLADDQLAAAQALRRTLDGCNALADQCLAALPAFKAWVQNQATYDIGASLMLVDKAADSYSDTSAMIAHGALRRFYQPKTPAIDPAAAVGDTELRHRHDQRNQQ